MTEKENQGHFTYDSIKESAAYQAEKAKKFQQDLAIAKFKVLISADAAERAKFEKRRRKEKIIGQGKNPVGTFVKDLLRLAGHKVD